MTDNTETMNDILSRMPQTQDHLTREQFEARLAGRKEAGRVIDIETCELGRWYVWMGDPYDAYDVPPEMQVAEPTATYARPQATAGSVRQTCRARSARRCTTASSAGKDCIRPHVACIRFGSSTPVTTSVVGRVTAKRRHRMRPSNGSRSTIRHWPEWQSAKSGRGSKRSGSGSRLTTANGPRRSDRGSIIVSNRATRRADMADFRRQSSLLT